MNGMEYNVNLSRKKKYHLKCIKNEWSEGERQTEKRTMDSWMVNDVCLTERQSLIPLIRIQISSNTWLQILNYSMDHITRKLLFSILFLLKNTIARVQTQHSNPHRHRYHNISTYRTPNISWIWNGVKHMAR